MLGRDVRDVHAGTLHTKLSICNKCLRRWGEVLPGDGCRRRKCCCAAVLRLQPLAITLHVLCCCCSNNKRLYGM
jgi:hypothetical protein